MLPCSKTTKQKSHTTFKINIFWDFLPRMLVFHQEGAGASAFLINMGKRSNI